MGFRKAIKRAVLGTLLLSVMLCPALMPMGTTYAYRGLTASSLQPTDDDAGEVSDSVGKDETIYVILDHDGTVLEQRVVNRIYGKGDVKEVRDYGRYSSVRNMETPDEPGLEDGLIVWDGRLLKKGDIYYEGITDKELPVEVSIKYFLDGREVDARELAGRTGDVRIEVEIKNRLSVERPITYESYAGHSVSKEYEHYIPFMVQVSYPVDLDVFSDIKADDAVKVVTGRTMNLSFATFPYPDARVTFEMTGSDIELEPITFTVIPQVPPVPDVDMEDELVKMLDGVRKIRNGFKQFHDAVQPMTNGGIRMPEGRRALDEGISALIEGSSRLDESSGELIGGFDAGLKGLGELKDGLSALVEGLSGVALGVSGLAGSAEELYAAVDSLSLLAGQLQAAAKGWEQSTSPGVMQLAGLNREMVAIAQKLVREQPEGSDLYRLGQMILQQNRIMEDMGGVQGLMQSSTQLVEAINALKEGTDKLKEGVKNQLVPGIRALDRSIAGLASGAEAALRGMEEYQKGQMAYRQGLVKYVEGVGGLNHGLNALRSNFAGIFAGMDSLTGVLEKMAEGLSAMDSQGLAEMEGGLIKAIDDMRFARALKRRMEELVDGYRSFMDNERNRNSSVQFILRTKKVDYQHEGKESQNAEAARPGGNVWERLLDLFGL